MQPRTFINTSEMKLAPVKVRCEESAKLQSFIKVNSSCILHRLLESKLLMIEFSLFVNIPTMGRTKPQLELKLESPKYVALQMILNLWFKGRKAPHQGEVNTHL